jgi:uncharacterized protein (DUF2252 family)
MKKKAVYVAPSRRQATLLAQRNLKMASSSQAYVRGSTVQFYQWLEESGAREVPKGPPIWICGDCHSGNLGPVADAAGAVHIQVRDLDQTVIGNPNHDLIRLALSLGSAARGSALPGVTTARMLEQMMDGYLGAFGTGRRGGNSDKPECVKVVMRRAVGRTWKHLAKERLSDTKPTIPLGNRFWPLSAAERRAIERLFDDESVRQLVTVLQSRPDDAKLEVLDAAYWMKGCSSLGRLRYAVLLGVAGKRGRDRDYCLIDIKEAILAAAPRARSAPMPKDNAKRVVEGARQLAPALGERMLATRFLDRSVFLRELMPQDLKLEIDRINHAEAITAARYLAAVVGKAHARQMDAATRKEFRRGLRGQESKRLSAPSWLWSSVVELTAAHEAAYLEHCREYVLANRRREKRAPGASP